MDDDKLKYVASAYINAGIIRNAEYDTVIIGSSLSQNFDIALMREMLEVNPVKINTGGITLEQRNLFYDAVEKTQKADTYYIEVDLTRFNSSLDTMEDTPVYMYDNNTWNDLKYLYSYETWFRAVPVSMAYSVLTLMGYEIDTMYNLDVDHVGEWHYRDPVGEDILKKNYTLRIGTVSEQETESMKERMMKNVDEKLTYVINPDNEYVFYFPPHCVLFWYDAQSSGYFDTFLEVREYIMEVLLQYPNVKIYDFQGASLICNLNNYRDTTHYGKYVNDWMVKCFATAEYQVTYDNYRAMNQLIEARLADFENKKPDWIVN